MRSSFKLLESFPAPHQEISSNFLSPNYIKGSYSFDNKISLLDKTRRRSKSAEKCLANKSSSMDQDKITSSLSIARLSKDNLKRSNSAEPKFQQNITKNSRLESFSIKVVEPKINFESNTDSDKPKDKKSEISSDNVMDNSKEINISRSSVTSDYIFSAKEVPVAEDKKYEQLISH